MSKKGDKTTSMEIPPWLTESLKPYITDAVNKGQAMSNAAWDWGMSNNPQYSQGAYGSQEGNILDSNKDALTVRNAFPFIEKYYPGRD